LRWHAGWRRSKSQAQSYSAASETVRGQRQGIDAGPDWKFTSDDRDDRDDVP
jgi:hypothetical protein